MGSDLDAGHEGLAQHDVTFALDIEGVNELIVVHEVTLSEALNDLPHATVRAIMRESPPSSRELLRRNCTVSIQRPGSTRHFKGIIWQATVHETTVGEHLMHLRITTAARLLDHIVDTYMYQNVSGPDIVKDLVQRYLAPARRTVDTDRLDRSYPAREYTLQYRESAFNFLCRICEEEGIFFFFDHDAEGQEHEVLVLADVSRGLSIAETARGGAAPYNGWADPPPGEEVILQIERNEEVGATDIVLSGYDWTNTELRILEKRTDRGAMDPRLEIYEHRDAVLLHSYSGRQYEANDAEVQANRGAELLDVSRQRWMIESTVLASQAGYLLKVTGAPDDDLDQEYLLTTVSGTGRVVAGEKGVWHATLGAVPTSMPYRPARKSPRPVVHGPETAVVVGPAGSDEIYTDGHGRVKVQFHWDRQHGHTDESSCWLRVAHNWAGNGFGTFFLPRRGMEVVVSFLGGNPDRPLVTGCVYNGSNHLPNLNLPNQKTQSVIRTQSSGPSGTTAGYNELRFDDLDGQEFVSLHAQRDLLEKVLRNRTTEILNDDQLTVSNDRTTRIHRQERHQVDGNARWRYLSTARYSYNRRKTSIGNPDNEGAHDHYLNCTERITAFGDTFGSPVWSDLSDRLGRFTTFSEDSSWLMQFENGEFLLHCKNDGATKLHFSARDGVIDMGGKNRIQLVSGESALSGIQIEPSKVAIKSPGEIEAEVGDAKLTMSSSSITLQVGGTTLTLDHAGVTINAPMFTQTGTVTTIAPSASALVASASILRGDGNPLWG